MKRLEPKPRLHVIATRTQTDLADLACDLALFSFDRSSLQWSTGTGSDGSSIESVAVIEGIPTHVARELAKLHNQASFLVIAENDRQVYEVDAETGFHKALGQLECVDHTEAHLHGTWTFFDGRYYVARGRNQMADLPEGI